MPPNPSKQCTCRSMKPGARILSLAETTFRARLSEKSRETSRILPSLTATSITACKCCPGSMTVPPLISKSQSWGELCTERTGGLAAVQRLSEASNAVPPARKFLENSRRANMNCRPRVNPGLRERLWYHRSGANVNMNALRDFSHFLGLAVPQEFELQAFERVNWWDGAALREDFSDPVSERVEAERRKVKRRSSRAEDFQRFH